MSKILLGPSIFELAETYKPIIYFHSNEPYFPGHFPHHPIMPGVLILEALAQATGILAFRTLGHIPDENSLYYFVGVDKARFKQPVVPGDQIRFDVNIIQHRHAVWKFAGKAFVDDSVVSEAEFTAMVSEEDI